MHKRLSRLSSLKNMNSRHRMVFLGSLSIFVINFSDLVLISVCICIISWLVSVYECVHTYRRNTTVSSDDQILCVSVNHLLVQNNILLIPSLCEWDCRGFCN